MSKDKPRHEVKKPKKGAKKEPTISSVITPTPEVELIRKARKPKEEEEEG